MTKREFSCDACQKEFASKETLTAHLGTHVQVCISIPYFSKKLVVIGVSWDVTILIAATMNYLDLGQALCCQQIMTATIFFTV